MDIARIKFRAWLPGSLTKEAEMVHDDHPGDVLFWAYREGVRDVMPFTGLHDAQGQPIYEKDIVEDEDGERFVIAYKAETGTFGLHSDDGRFLEFSQPWPTPGAVRVLGNVYEAQTQAQGVQYANAG